MSRMPLMCGGIMPPPPPDSAAPTASIQISVEKPMIARPDAIMTVSRICVPRSPSHA